MKSNSARAVSRTRFMSQCVPAGHQTGLYIGPVIDGDLAFGVQPFAAGEFLPMPFRRRVCT